MDDIFHALRGVFFSTNIEKECKEVFLSYTNTHKYPFIYINIWEQNVRLGYYNTHRKECIWYGNGIGEMSHCLRTISEFSTIMKSLK